MPAAPNPAGLATQPDPHRDRGGKPVPERIAEILSIIAILAEYGRHLADTIEHRAVWRGFATIAQFFGTAALPVILARIRRGIMRAVALERVLLERAARGRDLVFLAPREYSRRQAQPAAPPPPEPAAGSAAGPQPAALRPARRIGPDEPLTLDALPSMEQLEAEIRRRPLGCTIAAICRDLGAAPTLCAGPFWSRLFDAIRCYRGSVNVVLEMRRREKRFDKEHWKHPNLALPEESREGVRRVLGFFIGEPPIDPFRSVITPSAPVATAATGPP
jgi:hypothetical protein